MLGTLTKSVSNDDPATDAWNRHFWYASRTEAVAKCPRVYLRYLRLVRALLKAGFDVVTCPNWRRINATLGGERLSADVWEDRGEIHFSPINDEGRAYEASEAVLEAFEQASLSVGFPKQKLAWFAIGREGSVKHAARTSRERSLCGEAWRGRGVFLLSKPDEVMLICEACETLIREKILL